jgi:hypothetical protein
MSKLVSGALVFLIIVSFLGAAYHYNCPKRACPLCSKLPAHAKAITARVFGVLVDWQGFSFSAENEIVISHAFRRILPNRSPPL